MFSISSFWRDVARYAKARNANASATNSGITPQSVTPQSASETELPTLPAPFEIAERDEIYDSDTPWHVVLLDDDFHTYDYVIEMLIEIFGYGLEKAFRMTVEVDTRKRVIVWTGHLEKAEAYQGEIHEFGADWRMESSKGSMTAVLEPAR